MQPLLQKKLSDGSFTLPQRRATLRAMPDAHKRPIHDLRWRNFRALLTGPGAMTAAAAKLGKSQGQVSHFGGRNPIKVIGDDIAAQIEAAWGLPDGWLDVNHSEPGDSTGVGKTQPQSQPLTLDPTTLREAYLLAYQQASLELGIAHKYKLEDDPARTINAYSFLAAGGGNRSASEIAGFIAAAMRQGQHTGDTSGEREIPERRTKRRAPR